MHVLKNVNGQYDTAEIQFSLPINDSSVNVSEFSFGGMGNNPDNRGQSFNTNVTSVQRANDEHITITFNAKSSVNTVNYTQGALKGTNGILVETQTIKPTLEQ